MSGKGIPSGTFSYQTTITSVKFGEECTFVGDTAFKECTSLSEINEDNVIQNIGEEAFDNTKLSKANFDKLSTMKSGAFKNCTHLNSISIPECGSIPSEAFKDCTSLNEINMKSATEIGESAFEGCVSLTSVMSSPNCNFIRKGAFKGCSNLKDINLNDFKIIEDEAFKGCNSLGKISLDKCYDIRSSAFEGCENITQLTLSASEAYSIIIGDKAFANCPNLTKVYIEHPEGVVCKLGENAFCNCDVGNSKPSDSNFPICNDKIVFYFSPNIFDYYKKENLTDDNLWWEHYPNKVIMVNNNQIIYISNDSQKIEIDNNVEYKSNEYYGNYGIVTFGEGKKIENFNMELFRGKSTLTSIDIPSECKIIGDYEFEGCENLINITLSNVLEEIHNYAFSNCKSLTTFTIPETITSLGEGIFAGCENLEKLDGNFVTYEGRAVVYNDTLICVIPKDNTLTEGRIHNISSINPNITRLGNSCFHGCVNMRRVDIPASVTSIGNDPFYGCSNLCEIHFKGATPPDLNSGFFNNSLRQDLKIFVPENSFEAYCEKFKECDYEEYVKYIYPKIENGIIYYADNKINTITLNSQLHKYVRSDYYENGNYYRVSHFGDTLPTNYFSGQASLKQVILGENITKISTAAFEDCENLQYIYLSDGVNELNDRCFSLCKSLKRIHIPFGTVNSTNNIIIDPTETDKLIKQIEDTTPKSAIETVSNVTFGDMIFYGCSNLEEFGTYFRGCVSEDNRCYMNYKLLQKTLMFFAQGNINNEIYELPNVVNINKYAFRGSNLKKVKLNQHIKNIGDYAFANCSNLLSITDWDNVTNISEFAFLGCTNLGKISLPSNLTTISKNAFTNCYSMYINSNIPDSVTTIGEYAFYNCSEFKCIDDNTGNDVALTLGNISSINKSTFYNCKQLTEVNISDKISKIDDYAFGNCELLNTVLISPETSCLSTINTNAFCKCTNLKKLNLPNNLTYIGNYAFDGCVQYSGGEELQEELQIPPYVNLIGAACFQNTGVKKLNISSESDLSSISDSAFSGCKSLISVTMANAKNIQSIGRSAFEGCVNLSQLDLPNTIKIIGDRAFNRCIIESVTLPTKLTQLGDLSFATGMATTEINIPNDLSTPPSFIMNGNININSNPLGNISTSPYNIPKINVSSSLASTYRNNTYWSKYSSRIMAIKEPITYAYIDITNCRIPKASGEWNIYGNSGLSYYDNYETYAIFHSKNIAFNGQPISIPCVADTNLSGKLRLRINTENLTQLRNNTEYYVEMTFGMIIDGTATTYVTYLFDVFYNNNNELLLNDSECHLVLNRYGNLPYTNTWINNGHIAMRTNLSNNGGAPITLSSSGNFGYSNIYLLSSMTFVTTMASPYPSIQMVLNNNYYNLGTITAGVGSFYMLPSSMSFKDVINNLRQCKISYVFS